VKNPSELLGGCNCRERKGDFSISLGFKEVWMPSLRRRNLGYEEGPGKDCRKKDMGSVIFTRKGMAQESRLSGGVSCFWRFGHNCHTKIGW